VQVRLVSEERTGWRGLLRSPALPPITALLSVIVAGVSAYIAYSSSQDSASLARQQAEASAPLLTPGTPPNQRAPKHERVVTENAIVTKRLDRLYVDRAGPPPRLVVPIRNGGSGIGLTIGQPVVVETCDGEPAALAARGRETIRGPLGDYVLPSGSSDQLAFVSTVFRRVHGTVYVGSNKDWYTFDFGQFGLTKPNDGFAYLLIWYTDGAQRKLRWVCIQYQLRPGDSTRDKTEWAVNQQIFGATDLPSFLKVSP
jgi:hypothetical protein